MEEVLFMSPASSQSSRVSASADGRCRTRVHKTGVAHAQAVRVARKGLRKRRVLTRIRTTAILVPRSPESCPHGRSPDTKASAAAGKTKPFRLRTSSAVAAGVLFFLSSAPMAIVSAQSQQMASPQPQSDQGSWLLRSFVEHMHCEAKEEQDVEFWHDVHRLTSTLDPLSEQFDNSQYDQVRESAGLPALPPLQDESPQGQQQTQQFLVDRITHVANLLKHILVPYKVVDPVFALECPLGTAALLRQFARYCLQLFQEQCRGRAVRVLQLAKLMTLFNFPDYGTMMGQSKWRADLGTLSAQVFELYGSDAQTASPLFVQKLTAAAAALPIPISVGIVSYCNYGSSSFPLPGWSRRNKNAYAKKHGYQMYHLEKPLVKQYHPWMNKLLAVRHYLPNHDWIMWVDCDAYFTNFEQKIEALLVDATSSSTSSFDFVIAEDGNMFNSGVFLIRNSPWGHKFLNNSIDLLAAPMPYSFQHNQWHEQSPFMYLALVPHILDLNTLSFAPRVLGEKSSEAADAEEALVVGREAAGRDEQNWRTLGYDPEHVRVVPQSLMNSYPPELVGRTQHALRHHGWRSGDFVISFNGCGSVLGGEMCVKMFGDYFDKSMVGVVE